MKKIFMVALAVCSLVLSLFANAEMRPEISRYVKSYSGPQGVKIWTLRVGPVHQNEAIVQIGGIDHPWDMRIQKMKTESAKNNRINYVATVDGKRFVVLVMGEASGELYLPGASEAKAWVRYDESLSNAGNAERFLTDYLEQGKKP